ATIVCLLSGEAAPLTGSTPVIAGTACPDQFGKAISRYADPIGKQFRNDIRAFTVVEAGRVLRLYGGRRWISDAYCVRITLCADSTLFLPLNCRWAVTFRLTEK